DLGQGVDVVEQAVRVLEPQGLADPDPEHVRVVLAALLVDHRRLGRGGKAARDGPLDPHHDVAHGVAGSEHQGLARHGARVLCGAGRIGVHGDGLQVGDLPGVLDGAGDVAGEGRAGGEGKGEYEADAGQGRVVLGHLGVPPGGAGLSLSESRPGHRREFFGCSGQTFSKAIDSGRRGSRKGTRAWRPSDQPKAARKTPIQPTRAVPSSKLGAIPAGWRLGITSQWRSSSCMTRSQMAAVARGPGRRLTARGRRKKNGTTKWPRASTMLAMRQEPAWRWAKKTVSSGRLAYQMSRYCENAM